MKCYEKQVLFRCNISLGSASQNKSCARGLAIFRNTKSPQTKKTSCNIFGGEKKLSFFFFLNGGKLAHKVKVEFQHVVPH